MIRLDNRLKCAADMLEGMSSVADIGCDHGKLTASLLLEGRCTRVVAGDISPDCLEKTRRIIDRYSLQDRAEARMGSGLSILSPGECDSAAVLGMGGELIVDMLAASPSVAESMERIVLQPMSGIEPLRHWLYDNHYHVIFDKIVTVGKRWYQLICVKKESQQDQWPAGFPTDCYLVGYHSFLVQDPLLLPYCEGLMKKRLVLSRQAAGTHGEDKLAREAGQLEKIIKEIRKWN